MTPQNQVTAIFAFVALMSLISFFSMGIDKRRAIKHKRRTPEKRLFLYAILFGATGGTLGMYTFHHKTMHWYFAVFFPLLAVIQLAACIYLSVIIIR